MNKANIIIIKIGMVEKYMIYFIMSYLTLMLSKKLIRN